MDETTRTLNGKLGTLVQEEVTIRSRGTVAHVMQERNQPPIAYVLFRGEYDKRRDKVKAGDARLAAGDGGRSAAQSPRLREMAAAVRSTR